MGVLGDEAFFENGKPQGIVFMVYINEIDFSDFLSVIYACEVSDTVACKERFVCGESRGFYYSVGTFAVTVHLFIIRIDDGDFGVLEKTELLFEFIGIPDIIAVEESDIPAGRH